MLSQSNLVWYMHGMDRCSWGLNQNVKLANELMILLHKQSKIMSLIFHSFLSYVIFPASRCPEDKVRPSYLSSLKMLTCHVPYQRLVLGFVFSTFAFQVQLVIISAYGFSFLILFLFTSKSHVKQFVLFFSYHLFWSQMSLGNFALFCSHTAGLGAQFQHLLLVLLVRCS